MTEKKTKKIITKDELICMCINVYIYSYLDISVCNQLGKVNLLKIKHNS